MTKIFVSIGALLFAAAILLMSSGLQGTLLAVRGNAEGFPLAVIALMMSCYYVGFIVGCQFCPPLVAQVVNIRALRPVLTQSN